ncbi:MAG: antibiotic biosynthesis monooxygenase [Campylobacterales bacterium]|nr:antibiotic biosynthesis monooxygenase [Campylobacterales bacterium]NQY54028.1 antibiotic biosynthesis monooxygenase [Campylobacteraceae bacterium]
MILEVAILYIKDNQEKDFENNMRKASKIIAAQKGYISHEVKKCLEKKNKYILLVNWKTLIDHEHIFRNSKDYQEWKKLLHHFYEPFPIVEHYKSIKYE